MSVYCSHTLSPYDRCVIGLQVSLHSSLQLYYTPDTLQTYLALNYEEKIDPARNSGTKADNIIKTMSKYIPQGEVEEREGRGRGREGEKEGGLGENSEGITSVALLCMLGYSTNLDEYLTRISKSHDFRPHGKLLHVYTKEDGKYEVYKV